MRTAAWLVCWPLLGLLWLGMKLSDAVDDGCAALDRGIDWLLDRVEAE